MQLPKRSPILPLLVGLFLLAGAADAQQQIKPGWNLFSPQQDVQLGREAAKEIEQEVEIVDDGRLTNYVSRIGKRLAGAAPGADYPYSFKVVAEPSINAFALPGGPIYVHSGLIAAADNEAQLAGVLAHEIGHVALRHSTHQASKAYAFQIPLALAGGLIEKKGGLLGALSSIGISFGLNSLFLKYSRDAEKDADILGARMLAEANYDPTEMATFFEKLEKEGGGGRMPQFFSDHPNPGNRVRYVTEEVNRLPSGNYTKGETAEFRSMKARAAGIKSSRRAPGRSRGQGSAKVDPSNRDFLIYEGPGYQVSYPHDWKVYEPNQGTALTAAPDDGIIRNGGGSPAIARGLLAGYFDSGQKSLGAATDKLIEDLRKSNPSLYPLRGQRREARIHGQRAESVLLEGESALPNQREFVWLVASQRPRGLFYMLLISPESQYSQLREPYEKVVQSVRFE